MSLYGALLKGKYSKARRLIHRRAGINMPGDDGKTPLMLSAQHFNMVDVTRLLLLAGADVNARNIYGETALMMSLSRPDNFENVSILIDHGADTSLVTVYGHMPRDFAIYDAAAVFDCFFPENTERRAIRQKAKTADAAALEKICREQQVDDVLLRVLLSEAVYSEDAGKVEALLKFGVPVDSLTYDGATALFYAACRTRVDLVKLLLRYGANPAHQNYQGETAIMKMKTCFPGMRVAELLYCENYALEVLGKERMEEIITAQSEIERMLTEDIKTARA